MGILNGLFGKKKEAPQAQTHQEVPQVPKGVIKSQRFILENIEPHMDVIMELVEKNEDYKLSKKQIIDEGKEDEKIYEFYLNERATLDFLGGGGPIHVLIDGEYIGDIKKGNTARVKNILKKEVKSIWAEVSGGKYKIVRYSSEQDEFYYDKLENQFSITIEITYREEIKEQ